MTQTTNVTTRMLTAGPKRDLYGFVSAAFLGDVGVLTDLVQLSNDKLEVIMAVPGGAELIESLQETVREKGKSTAFLHETLTLEYDNLFVVPGPNYVPPFASWYCESRETMPCPVADPSPFYRAVGFTLPQQRALRPDHVGCELGFLFAASDLARQGVEVGEQLGKDFLRRHVSAWFDAFCDAVTAEPFACHYAGLARLVQDLIRADLDGVI